MATEAIAADAPVLLLLGTLDRLALLRDHVEVVLIPPAIETEVVEAGSMPSSSSLPFGQSWHRRLVSAPRFPG